MEEGSIDLECEEDFRRMIQECLFFNKYFRTLIVFAKSIQSKLTPGDLTSMQH